MAGMGTERNCSKLLTSHRRTDFNATLSNMKDLPRLVSGKCPDCPSTEIVVKEIDLDGTSYEGYCVHCGIDVFGALISAAQAVVLK